MPVKIKDYITRDTGVLMQTFNTAPNPECVIQNQRLILEVTCDVRKELLEVLHLLSWLGSPTKLKKRAKIEVEVVPLDQKISRRAESKLPFKERAKVISDRFALKEAPTDEEVEAF